MYLLLFFIQTKKIFSATSIILKEVIKVMFILFHNNQLSNFLFSNLYSIDPLLITAQNSIAILSARVQQDSNI